MAKDNSGSSVAKWSDSFSLYRLDRAGAAMADKSEVYFEITIIGTSAKVVALDAATGIEVVAIAPAKTSEADLKQLALGKLKRAIAREAENP